MKNENKSICGRALCGIGLWVAAALSPMAVQAQSPFQDLEIRQGFDLDGLAVGRFTGQDLDNDGVLRWDADVQRNELFSFDLSFTSAVLNLSQRDPAVDLVGNVVSFSWLIGDTAFSDIESGFSLSSALDPTTGLVLHWVTGAAVGLGANGNGGWDDQFNLYDPNDHGSLRPLAARFGASVSAVPEPESWALMLAGLGVIGALQRRRRHT